MNVQQVLVDGYSVLHLWPALRRAAGRGLQQQRDALVRVLQQYADATQRNVTVVFDGYAARHQAEPAPAGPLVSVCYSPSGKTADDVIERLVAQSPCPETVLVVSSDNALRQTCEALGTTTCSVEIFLAELDTACRELQQQVRHHSRPRRLGQIRDHLP